MMTALELRRLSMEMAGWRQEEIERFCVSQPEALGELNLETEMQWMDNSKNRQKLREHDENL